MSSLMRKVTLQFAAPLAFATNHLIYTAKSGLCKGLRRIGGFGFLPSCFYKLTSEEKFLLSLDLKGKVVYDVGAFTGLTTLYFVRAVGQNGYVVAFEPNPILHDHINQHFRLNHLHNCVALRYAVGEKIDVANLVFDTKYLGAGSMAIDEAERIGRIKSSKTISVNVDSLDNLKEKHSLPTPNLVKIDVQGYEKNVLKGMTRILETYKPCLHIEIHRIPYGIWRKETLEWTINFLKNYGYNLNHVETGQPPNINQFHRDEHLYAF